MKADVELILTHDGERWIARNDWCVADGRTLGELDANVAGALRDNGTFGESRVAIFMGFDFDTIPTWMRQYGSHYFNRHVTLNLGGGGPAGGCAGVTPETNNQLKDLYQVPLNETHLGDS